MRRHIRMRALLALGAGLPVVLSSTAALPQEGQEDPPVINRTISDAPLDQTPSEEPPDDPVDVDTVEAAELPADELVHTPLTGIFPGAERPRGPKRKSPVADDPQAPWRGMGYFNQFNCVGCHAPNGAGGMGPSLSNTTFKYGGDDQDIFLTIKQGRPLGMPFYGALLPDEVVWDLVEYVQSISKDANPDDQWGTTTSLKDFGPEQVPAQYQNTPTPWENTQPFSYGQPPRASAKTPDKPE